MRERTGPYVTMISLQELMKLYKSLNGRCHFSHCQLQFKDLQRKKITLLARICRPHNSILHIYKDSEMGLVKEEKK